MKKRFGISILAIGILLQFCTPKNKFGRFISEKDTSFPKDIRDISAKINSNPDDAELYYRRGNTFFFLNRFKDAIIDFKTAIQLNGNNAIYQNKIGEAYLGLDTSNTKLIMEHFKKAVSLNPAFHEAKFNLAKLFTSRQQYEEAGKIWNELNEVPEYKARALAFLGIGRKEQGDTASAISFFEKCLIVDPDFENASLQLAKLYESKTPQKAILFYDKVLVKNPENYEALYGKGYLLQIQNKYDEALKYYDMTRTVNPSHKLAIYNSAYIHSEKYNFEQALENCNKILDIEPSFYKALSLRGLCYEILGYTKEAIADYKAALQLNPKEATAIKGLNKLTGS